MRQLPHGAGIVLAVPISLAMWGVLIAGCSSYPQRFEYHHLPPNLNIVYARQESVQAHYLKVTGGGGNLDDGQRFDPKTRKIRCFYNSATGTIFVSRGEDSCLAHELCHLDGRPAAECDKEHVRD